jgi:hypothetical protein
VGKPNTSSNPMSAASAPADDVKLIVLRTSFSLFRAEHVAEAQTARSADYLGADGL